MAIFTPLRLDRVQQGLFEALADATDVDVGWSYSEVPQESLTAGFVSLTMVGGPGPFIRKHRRGRTLQPIDDVTLTIGLLEEERIGIVLNDFNYFVDTNPLMTINAVRLDLLNQINDANNIEPVTASNGGPAELILTADFLGAIASLSIYGESLTAGTPTLNDDFVLVTEGTQTMLVNVQAYAKEREPRLGAWSIIQQCIAALQTEDLVELLRRFGVGIWDHSSPIDLSAIAGGHWETRASFDLTLSARARWVRPVDVIETVTGTVNGDAFTAVSP